MATRGRTCPACAQRWPQRDASFCGSCGALLAPVGLGASPRRDVTAVAIRLVAAMAAIGLVAAASSTDLVPRTPDPGVRIGADDPTSPTPLTETEVAALRLQSDPDRLRCEPVGCELWRHHRPEVVAPSGAVVLGTGAIALLVAEGPTTASHSWSSEAGANHHLVAFDPATGDERWSRSLADLDTTDGGDGPRLAAGPDGGVMIVSGAAVVAVDEAGERRWTWDDHAGGISRAITTPQAVIVVRENRHGPFTRHHLTALEPATARVLWDEAVRHVAAFDTDLLAVVDSGRIRALDHASGETLWEAAAPDGRGTRVRLEGGWLVVQHAHALVLLDPTSGREVGRVGGWLTSSLVPAGDRWLGTMRAPDPDLDASWLRAESGEMDVVALHLDGSVGWRSHLGTIRPWRECCPLQADDATGIATIVDPVRVQSYDLGSGALIDVRVTTRDGAAASRNPGLSDTDVWRPYPDIEVARHPDDGTVRVRTHHGDLHLRSASTIAIASLEPIVVTDGRWVMGARPVETR